MAELTTTKVISGLVNLGLDLKSISIRVELTTDRNDVIHASCPNETPKPTKRETLSIAEISLRELCACAEETLWATPPVLSQGADLLNWHEQLDDTLQSDQLLADSYDPDQLADRIRRLDRAAWSVAAIGENLNAPGGVAALESICLKLRSEINARRALLLSAIRSPQARNRLIGKTLLPAANPREFVFALKSADLLVAQPPGWRSTYALAFGMGNKVAGKGMVFVGPYLATWTFTQFIRHPATLITTGEDVEQLAETAYALWQPDSTGPLADFNTAVKAARACLA